MAYTDDIAALGADHHWKFDGNANDEIGAANGTGSGVGWPSTPIAEDAAACLRTDSTGERVSIPTTTDIDGAAQTAWAFGGWFETNTTQEPPKSIAGRGNEVDSMRFVLFLGNNVMLEADPGGSDPILQVFADRFLADDRPYHLFARWSGSGGDNVLDFFVDGVKMTSAEPANRQPGIASFPATSVLEFGDPAGTVSVGGATVLLNAPVNGYWNHWVTFAGAVPTDTEVREELFEKGALPDVTIATDSQANMQLALDALASTVRPDAPLCIRVEDVSGGGDLTLTADNVTFDPLASIHVQWMGTGTLTWRNDNGSDASIVSTPNGGTVVIRTETDLTISGLQNPSEVRVYEAGTTTEVAGTESVTTGSVTYQVFEDLVDIVVMALDYEYLRLEDVDTSVDVSLSLTQFSDRVYRNDP